MVISGKPRNFMLAETVVRSLTRLDAGFRMTGAEEMAAPLHYAVYVSWKYAKGWKLSRSKPRMSS